MDDAILALVVERLDRDEQLTDDAQYLVLAACEGTDELSATLGGDVPDRPAVAALVEGMAVEAPGAYLGEIAVEGFRGIGQRASLDLKPGVGLTLVVGRNGSAKSSFAEALEVLLTGDNYRWAARSKIWKEGWRNLHHGDGRRIAATFVVEARGEVEVIRTWGPAATELTDGEATAQAKGKPRGPLEELGWSGPLASYRPFLSYNELGRMLDEGPSHLYDALAAILGLEELVEAHERLGAERRAREKRRKEAATWLRQEILPSLDESDEERATECAELLRERDPDLERVAELATGSGAQEDDGSLQSLRRLATLSAPITLDDAGEITTQLREAARRVEQLAATAGARARDTAKLLEEALAFHEHHGDGDCPVCGTAGMLDGEWRSASQERLRRLQHEAQEASAAASAADAARGRVRRSLSDPRAIARDAEVAGIDAEELITAWTAWADLSGDPTLEGLAAHVESRGPDLIDAVEALRATAAGALESREDAWRPIAARVAAWVQQMREAIAEAEPLPALKAAEAWLKDTTDDVRADRFAPLATSTKDIWATLGPQSNVELVDVVLAGSSTNRRVDLQVNVDGVEGAALGVMSQGELHSLALALFFPRATLPESPFRFVVIDDPVQSMDPTRVDGLARVLETVAATRQVVVFTHDDRLPQSVRQLGIEATILEVTRRANSVVEVREALDPVTRYIQDAWALIRTDELPDDAARRVVPGFCRMALEAAFLLAYRRRRLREGASHAEVEAAVEAATTASKKAALGLHGDITRTKDVLSRLNNFGGWAPNVFKMVQSGSHKAYGGDLEKMVSDTRDLARKVLEKHG